MATALEKSGQKVTLYGMAGGLSPRKAAEALRHDFEVGDEVGIVLLPLVQLKLLKPFYGLLAALRVSSQSEIIVSRSLTGAFFASLRGFPVVLELHEPVPPKRGSGRWFLSNLIASKTLQFVVVITHALENQILMDWPALKGKTLVLPDGATPRTTRLDVATVVDHSALEIGYVGHLYPGKGAQMLPRLAELMPDQTFHVVGGHEADVAQFRAEHQIPQNLTLHGWIPPNLVAAKLTEFDLLLLPNLEQVLLGNSQTDIGRWTSPLKLFEYMSSGRPIIASDLPVLREVLTHGQNAWLCAPGRVEAWAYAISHLARSSRLRTHLATNAEHDLLHKFSWQKRAERLIGHYKEAPFSRLLKANLATNAKRLRE